MAYEAMKEDIPTIELANEVTPGDLVSKLMSDMRSGKVNVEDVSPILEMHATNNIIVPRDDPFKGVGRRKCE